MMRKVFRIIAATLLVIILLAGAYILYMQLTYYRIEDNQDLEIKNNLPEVLQVDGEYTMLTFNIGFGAYSQDFTFFMDTGYMADGTPTEGSSSRAKDRDEVIKNTEGVIKSLLEEDCDFYLLQEVHTDSTTNYHVDQLEMIDGALTDYASAYAVNFHTSYLAYPFPDMFGVANGGIVTYSKYQIDNSVRRSFPVTNGFIGKFVDLDRCFSVSRIPIDNGKDLVIINLHMSAYDEGGESRIKQMALLNEVLAQEKGNYVIVGGDYNQALYDSIDAFDTEQLIPDWVFDFEESLLEEGYSVVRPDNGLDISTCRGSDITWQKGVTYETSIDGFIVSDNLIVTAENLDYDYMNSDHNPVKLTFSFIED